MASPHTISPPPFLVFPALSPEYLWRVVATETNRTISRHKLLGNAVAKADTLNQRALVPVLPEPQYAERENYMARDERGTCQLWYDYPSNPGVAHQCTKPASITDLDTGESFCVGCYVVNFGGAQ